MVYSVFTTTVEVESGWEGCAGRDELGDLAAGLAGLLLVVGVVR